MTDKVQQIENVDDVAYVDEFGGDYRVVFKHRGDSAAVATVEEIVGCSGEMGATQEHLVSIEYPKEVVDDE